MCLKLDKKLALCVFVCGNFATTSVFSADWQVTKSLTVSEVYTDNVDLTHDNKKSEFITTVTPGISVQGSGARANVSLNGSIEANSLDGEGDAINPRLGADADAELLEDFLYIDASINIIQNSVDAFRPSGINTLSNTGNTTNTYNYQISPYITQRYKGIAEVVGRYTYNNQLNSNNNASDSNSQNFELNVNSGDDFQRLTWGASVNYKDSGSDNTNSELLSTDVSLGYRFNRTWSVNSSVGIESNDFESTRSENDGSQWSLSTIWTPNNRTSLNIGYGDRFFGSVPTLDFSHRSRRSLLTAGYSRELTDSATLLSQQSAFQTTDAFGNPIDPITGDPLSLANSTINITEGLFINEVFELSYTLTGRRSSVTIGGSHSVQIYEDGRADETLEEYNISVDRRLSSRLTLDAGYTYSQQERSGVADAFRPSQALIEAHQYNLGLTRKIGVDSNLKFTYYFTDSESDDLANDYQENRLQLSVTTKL
ncbi:TIGR03016 family PEP-CTERM system-associated outer membrane protein [Neptunomonas sp.]|uniref:TIGR03016 family PEP-CTERM system-associated outer membrane protein n=1 Tax=Neptunomonas sp. TaxID=1971898 RepID=UPI003563C292